MVTALICVFVSVLQLNKIIKNYEVYGTFYNGLGFDIASYIKKNCSLSRDEESVLSQMFFLHQPLEVASACAVWSVEALKTSHKLSYDKKKYEDLTK